LKNICRTSLRLPMANKINNHSYVILAYEEIKLRNW